MENYTESWLCSYNSVNQLFTVLCTSKQGASEDKYWSTLYRLDNLSDPNGDFVVFAETNLIGPTELQSHAGSKPLQLTLKVKRELPSYIVGVSPANAAV